MTYPYIKFVGQKKTSTSEETHIGDVQIVLTSGSNNVIHAAQHLGLWAYTTNANTLSIVTEEGASQKGSLSITCSDVESGNHIRSAAITTSSSQTLADDDVTLGKLEVDNVKLSATAGVSYNTEAGYSQGIYAGIITITNSEVNALGGTAYSLSCGIEAKSGSNPALKIVSSVVNATGGKTTFESSSSSTQGNSNGIWSTYCVEISGSSTKVVAKSSDGNYTENYGMKVQGANNKLSKITDGAYVTCIGGQTTSNNSSNMCCSAGM